MRSKSPAHAPGYAKIQISGLRQGIEHTHLSLWPLSYLALALLPYPVPGKRAGDKGNDSLEHWFEVSEAIPAYGKDSV